MKYKTFREKQRGINRQIRQNCVLFLRACLFVTFLVIGTLKVFNIASPLNLNTEIIRSITIDNYIFVIGLIEVAIAAMMTSKESLKYGVILILSHFLFIILPIFFFKPSVMSNLPYIDLVQNIFLLSHSVLFISGLFIWFDLHRDEYLKLLHKK